MHVNSRRHLVHAFFPIWGARSKRRLVQLNPPFAFIFYFILFSIFDQITWGDWSLDVGCRGNVVGDEPGDGKTEKSSNQEKKEKTGETKEKKGDVQTVLHAFFRPQVRPLVPSFSSLPQFSRLSS